MRLYSRPLLRKVVRSHFPEGVKLHGSNTDVIIYLAYLLFLQQLANEGRLRMQMDGARSRTLLRRHVVGAGRMLLRRKGTLTNRDEAEGEEKEDEQDISS